LQQRLRERVQTFPSLPDIYRRRTAGAPDIAEELNVQVHDWVELRRRRELDLLQAYGNAAAYQGPPPPARNAGDPYERITLRPMAKTLKNAQTKGKGGRSYTSKYRGVHQTFPTRRWEAQFRRNGRPTSLGCFDHEEEAARAYDKMMLWCELHGVSNVKGGVTNFDVADYESDVHWLQQVTQDELVQILRSDGRRQAQQRLERAKREGREGATRSSARQAAVAGGTAPANDVSAAVSGTAFLGGAPTYSAAMQ
jgi:hypothetical protein